MTSPCLSSATATRDTVAVAAHADVSTRRLVAIDIGRNGALALFVGGALAEVADMPTLDDGPRVPADGQRAASSRSGSALASRRSRGRARRRTAWRGRARRVRLRSQPRCDRGCSRRCGNPGALSHAAVVETSRRHPGRHRHEGPRPLRRDRPVAASNRDLCAKARP